MVAADLAAAAEVGRLSRMEEAEDRHRHETEEVVAAEAEEQLEEIKSVAPMTGCVHAATIISRSDASATVVRRHAHRRAPNPP